MFERLAATLTENSLTLRRVRFEPFSGDYLLSIAPLDAAGYRIGIDRLVACSTGLEREGFSLSAVGTTALDIHPVLYIRRHTSTEPLLDAARLARDLSALRAQYADVSQKLAAATERRPFAWLPWRRDRWALKRVEHEFARRFHPNTTAGLTISVEERAARERVFAEFWEVLKQITGER